MEVKSTKTVNNNENEYPSTSKRFKPSTKHIKLVNEEEDSKIFEEMGIGVLESEESSSSATSSSTVANLLPQICHSSSSYDENSNDDTLLDTPTYQLQQNYHHQQLQEQQQHQQDYKAQQQQQQHYCKELSNPINDDDIGNEASNTNFVDPNETLVASSNYKVGNSNIEIYVDNNKLTERIHKRLSNGSVNSKGRSPLALVSYNNNYSNINQINSNTSLLIETIKKQTYVPIESFFVHRTLQKLNGVGKDYFKKLSDEIILQIFKWLPKKTLIRCSYVCRRFHQLAQDESLWTRLDLGGKTLKSGAVGKVVTRGVVILRLAQAEMAHPIFEPDSIESLPEFQTKLQYLDLSMAVITKLSLKKLLSKCRQLKKLSLEHVKLNDEICCEISKNINLEALNLAMCEGIESWSIKMMMSSLKQLHSLNISWTSLNVESIKAIVDHITPNLLRLNIAGCRKAMFDSHLATLVKRCPGILELDLSDCTALSSTAVDIICNFKDLEYLSLSRCYNISASSYMKLSNLTSLSYLDVFGLLSDTALTVLQSSFPTVGINKFVYSSVARPTVGTRRTSIWGLRTRD